MALLQRQPFGELCVSQSHELSSTKNRQNAITDSLSLASQKCDKPLNSPNKRPLSLSIYEDNEDSENVDPTDFSYKRTKCSDNTPIKGSLFDYTSAPTLSLEPARPFRSTFTNALNHQNTPESNIKQKRKAEPSSAVSSTLSAPAGRSPKHKRVGILSKKRASLSPFRRIDPPAFSLSKSRPGSIPFSLDAALSGTLSSHSVQPKARTLQESVPKSWLFDIHEDSPDEEAANLMEHSACTLYISDEESSPSKQDERGKENIPPLDHPEQSVHSPLEAKAAKSRLTALADAMLDEGEERLVLSDLPAADFYAEGLDDKPKVNFVEQDDKIPAAEPLESSRPLIISLNGEETSAAKTECQDLITKSEASEPYLVTAG